jgi:ABC-type antimicrobial peptide transport system permease subunit
METIITSLRRLAGDPGKSLITIGTISLGIAVLILALSLSGFFSGAVDSLLREEGIIVAVGNGQFGPDGEYEQARPGVFDEKLIPALLSDVPGLESAAPIMNINWQYVAVEGNTYTPRSMVGSNEGYLGTFNLGLVAGANFAAKDVEEGKPLVLISEALAELWFGGAEAAIGKKVKPSMGNVVVARGGQGSQRAERFTLPDFTVVGVFETPTEILRKAYGIADMVIPTASFLPSGMGGRQFMGRMANSLIYARVRAPSIESAESLIRTSVQGLYGDDVTMTVWEGTPSARTSAVDDVRASINSFTVVTNILGFVLLFSGSIGILSIMLVDVLSRGREIALERAIGASKASILREYAARSLVISGLSLIIGIAVSLALGGPILALIVPVFSIFPESIISGSLISIQAIAIAGAAALATGAVLGMVPVSSAIKAPIIEGLREV